MSAEIISLSTDTFRPRRFAKTADDEIAIRADVEILWQIEAHARNLRYKVEHGGNPLRPSVRKNALEAMSSLKGE